MKNNKGISMITLIVTIVCIIIFLGIAYRIGSRYISESKEEEKVALTSILSDSVVRRQNDKYAVASGDKIYYTGYHLSSDDFEKLYDKFDKKDCMYEPGLWFVIDANKAEELGIVDSSKYLIDNINNVSSDEDRYIAVVDYYTGNVQLIKYQDVDGFIGDIVDGSDGTGCEHTYTILTCLEPSVCTKCGLVSANALAKDSSNFMAFTDATANALPNRLIACTSPFAAFSIHSRCFAPSAVVLSKKSSGIDAASTAPVKSAKASNASFNVSA